MKKIRICRIQVKNLFGTINYNIELPDSNPIAIITAPNGCGKTTILNLVSLVLNPSYDTFQAIRSIPFDEFRCVLSNGKVVELKQEKIVPDPVSSIKKGMSRALIEQAAVRVRSFFDGVDYELRILGNRSKVLQTMLYSETLLDALGMDPAEYLADDNEDIYFHLQGRSIEMRSKYVWKVHKQLLEKEDCIIPINFIKADRIQPVVVQPRRPRDYDEMKQKSPLKDASEEISKRIKSATDTYNDDVSKAKDRLPQMFLAGEGTGFDCDDFMQGWSVYREELNQFQEIGLITPTDDFTKGRDISSVYEQKGPFLSTYLSAFKDTTSALKDIYGRLDLFRRILDERNAITGKKVKFSREGISLHTGDREIKLDALSSGEKHDFIMFYNLIFNIKEGGLVLVDEPEISLHIEWQETYLDKLIAICEMSGLQAIIATHSPNIVSSHYDFLVDKGESEE